MRQLLFFIIGSFITLNIFAQKSPHGKLLQIDCSECHTTGSWVVNSLTSPYDHNKTKFLLTGNHQQLDCKICHLNLSFTDERGQSECVSCHLDVHQQTLGSDCAFCHTSQSWIINDVKEIHITSRFPLVGAHANADCFDCHLTENLLQFRPLGVECIDCHRQEFLSTTSPNHQQVGYSTECFDCHNMFSYEWSSGGIEHSFFPLTEGHAIDLCSTCHIEGGFQNITPDCESCHLADYNLAINPPHVSLEFPVNCAECHTTKPDWTPASFDRHNEYWVLEGAHAAIANECAQCHSASYLNTPNTCYGCHDADYNNANDPQHLGGNFPIDCIECHSQNAWKPSTFNHDGLFPIYSGSHNGEWNSCSECHTIASNYALFSCIDCHEHNKTDMDNEHQGENGYIYNSINCLDCHPNGKAD